MSIFNDTLEKHSLHPPVLYGISDRNAFPKLTPLDYLEWLFRTRASVIQWREKDLPVERARTFVRHGVKLARKTGKIFLVNTEITLALEEGTHGVHLTSEQSLSNALKIREQSPREDFLIGQSVHSLREIEKVEKQGVDYVLLGPILDPLSKQSHRSALGKGILIEAVQAFSIPVVAVGGIDESNLQLILGTGVSGAAGITWVNREVERFLGSERHH